MRSALGNTSAYIGVDADFLQQEAIELLPPPGVVLELLSTAHPKKPTLTRCHALVERGYSLALTNYQGIDDRSRPLLPLVSVVKIDLHHADQARLEELAGSLRQAAAQAAGAGLSTATSRWRCRNLGFALFQGRYFAHAEIVSGRRLSAAHATLIRLCNLVGRDVDTAVIEDAFKHEPALTLNLLRIVNSVGRLGNRSTQPVTSLRHAITLLGRRQLQRWLSLLLLAPGNQATIRSTRPFAAAAGRRPARANDGVAGRRRQAGRPQAGRPGVHHRHPVDDADRARPADERNSRTDRRRARSRNALRQHEGLLGTSSRCSSASTTTTPPAATACCQAPRQLRPADPEHRPEHRAELVERQRRLIPIRPAARQPVADRKAGSEIPGLELFGGDQAELGEFLVETRCRLAART
jgi:hypothetical protein